MNSTLRHSLCNFGAVILTFMILHSCKRTEYLDYEKNDLNEILSYKVTNSPQAMSGAIDNVTNTITVYIPYYSSMEHLIAEVTLDEGAKLLDSLGTEINLDGGLEPLAVGSSSVKYIVESASGKRRNYTVVQKVLPHADELVLEKDVLDRILPFSVGYGSLLRLSGNFNSLSRSCKIWLTNRATGKVYENFLTASASQVRYLSSEKKYYYDIDFAISENAVAGIYDGVIEHMGRKATIPPFELIYTPPMNSISYGTTTAFAPGDTVLFTSKNRGVFVGLERVYLKLQKSYLTKTFFGTYPAAFTDDMFEKPIEMKIVSWNRTELKVIMPELPVGAYVCTNSLSYTLGTGPGGNQVYVGAGIGIYCDYNNETNFGKDLGLGFFASLTVKEKQ